MISTKNIPTGAGGKTPKNLKPGNTTVKINSIYLEDYPWGENAYHLMFDLEGPAQPDGFEGFFIDKNNEALGRYAGQVSRVKASMWAYSDKTLDSGLVINRDVEISKVLQNIANATGCTAWLDAQDEKHETIESLVNQMNDDAPFADKLMDVCLAGKEYENKAGYTNFDLFFPKYANGGVPFEAADTENSKVLKFNDSHIVKKKVKDVDSFEATAGAAAAEDTFEL